MKLTSMKLSKNEKKSRGSENVADADRPDYPYGLKINLEKDCLKKLGLSVKNFKKGHVVEIHAKADVSGGSWHDDEYGESESVSLQITDMALKGVSKGKFQQFSEQSKKGPGE